MEPVVTFDSYFRQLQGEPSVDAVSDGMDTNALKVDMAEATQLIVVP